MTQPNSIVADRKVAALRQAMGPVIAKALADKWVVEVYVNPDGRIWIDRIGKGRSDTGERLAPADADRILRLLADHVGEVVTREDLMSRVWDTNWFGSTKTLDVHIGWLRRKLGDEAAEPEYIETVRGVGFRFVAPEVEAP